MSPVQDTEDIHVFTYYPIYFNDGNISTIYKTTYFVL